MVLGGIVAIPLSATTEMGAVIENDHPLFSLYGTDRGYSSGIAFLLAHSVEAPPLAGVNWLAQRLRIAAEGSDLHWSWGAGVAQHIYTPDNISLSPPDPNDRPYAGWLYGTLFVNARTPRTAQSFVFSGGLVGPAALGREVQTGIHTAFDIRKPEGWQEQITTEPGILALYRQYYRWWELKTGGGVRWFDGSPVGSVAIGNVLTYLALGGRLRLGYGLDDTFGPPALTPALSYAPFGYQPEPDSPWELSLFAGYEGRLIGRDIFLDGNTFTASAHVDRRLWMLEFETGLVVRYHGLRVLWRFVQSTTPFSAEVRYQNFGAVQIHFRL